MHWVASDALPRLWWREVVAQTAGWVGSTALGFSSIPNSEERDEEVTGESSGEHLRNDVQVGDERGLEDDWDVGSVEQLDGVGRVLAAVSDGLDWQIHSETLEVDDNKEDKDGGEEVHQVGQVLSVESFVQSSNFVLFSREKVEESNDGAFEFSSSADVDCSWREGLPDDRFANVGGDKEGDSGAETVAFGEELVEKKDDHSSDEELDDDQRADSSSHLSRIAVHSGQDVDDSLTESHDHTEELLSAGEKSSFFGSIADFDDFCAGEQLHDETRSDDWRDSKFHQSSTVRSENDSDPVEGISRFGAHDSEKRDLTTDKKDEKSNRSPEHFFAELNSSLRLLNFWEHIAKWPYNF